MATTETRTDAQNALAELMAVYDIRRKQAKAYVHSLTLDEMRSALRSYRVVHITELIDEITRGLMQDDLA